VDWTDQDLEDLRRAKRLLENPSFATRLANAVGVPIEKLIKMLPGDGTKLVATAATKALEAALKVAVRSLGAQPSPRSNAIHKVVVGGIGAIGGAFGLPAVILELPASTTVMLRSIAEIAESEGESLASADARLACLQVFALGGPAAQDDALESSYFAARALMAKALEDAAEYVAKHGVTSRGAPVLVRFITQIAARFGIPVSQKVVAQSVPVIGAAGGAAINVMFLAHFQDLARGHFIIRRLERKHGADTVRTMYSTV